MFRTPLYNACVKAGGKMTDFHGWELPVQFSGILAEYGAVRNALGVFDVSHMGRFFIDGKNAHKFLQTICCNALKNEPGAGTYSHVLNENGGVIDDIIAFCLAQDKFLVVVNSATKEKDFNWFNSRAKNFDVKITDRSVDLGMLAVQGPKALEVVGGLAENIKNLKRFHIEEKTLFASSCYITRTGYTGEDGVEIMAPPPVIEKVWDFFLSEGKKYGVLPCGLGARDVLRLEACYLLYGADMDETRTPYEASCPWVVKLNKAENFIGKAALIKQKAEGVKEKLFYFHLLGAGVPREGNLIFYGGKQAGKLTSGTYSPVLKGICCGYAPANLGEGAEVEIDNNGRRMKAVAVKKFRDNKV